MKKNPIVKITLLFAFVIAVVSSVFFLGVYTDYMQLKEIGANFTKVFWTNFNVSAVTFLIAFFLYFGLIFYNFIIIRSNLTSIDSSFNYLKKTIPFIIISVVISGVLANLTMNIVASKFLPFLTSEWFNRGDPIFNRDVGYYIFQRPFYIAIIDALLAFSGFLIIVTIAAYVALYARFDFYNMKHLLKEKGVIIHTIAGVIIYFLIKSVSYKFVSESILYNANKEFVGASYVDIHVWLPYYKIAPFILIAVVVATIICVLNSKIKGVILAVAAYPTIFLVASIIAGIMQTVVVSPNELAVEIPYLQKNIDFTRSAYKLDSINQKDFVVKNDLNGDTIMRNLETVNNIRLTDFNQTLKIANQVQSIRNYYNFTDTDIVVYDIAGKPTAVSVAAREINKDKLDESAKNYINLKMKYTHGMGVVMNPVNQITEQGQPRFIIKDVPPRSIDGAPFITQPRIYFGEGENDYIIANTKDKELDEIEPEGYSYDGSGGIALNFKNRLIYSFKYADFKLLFSSQISRDSKLLVNRNIVKRIQKAAPFLSIDSDPIILVDDDGRLKWVVDAYTTSSWYPYSEYNGNYNYIRNSVKVVVDAYDGTVKFYIIDQNDPIIKSYARIYPTLFEQTPFPADLSKHTRYPESLFKIQSDILKKYHITDPSDFYNKKGMWAVAKEKYDTEKQRDVAPYYNLMKLDGEKEEMVLMIPYTPAGTNRDNMVAWLAVRCNPQNYGELVAYNFNQNENIYGPNQIEYRIDIDPVISQDLTLWGQGGSNVIRGNLLVIPIENNLLYVEPVYISSGTEEGTLPEIKRIVVAYNDKVVAKPTLDEALKTLFNVKRPNMPITEDTLNSVIQKALQNFDDVKEYSKQNDWENYGKSFKSLDDSMKDLREKSKIVETPIDNQ